LSGVGGVSGWGRPLCRGFGRKVDRKRVGCWGGEILVCKNPLGLDSGVTEKGARTRRGKIRHRLKVGDRACWVGLCEGAFAFM